MRTITFPETSRTNKIIVTFHHIFGIAYSDLGRTINTSMRADKNGAVDYFTYTTADCDPEVLRANVEHYAAPGRDVKALVYCNIRAGNFGFGGLSFCYSGDIYSRLIGENLALRRAVTKAQETLPADSFSREDRQRVWQGWRESYKAAAKVWTEGDEATSAPTSTSAPTATGRFRPSQPAVQDLPRRKPSDPFLAILIRMLLADLPPMPTSPGLRRPYDPR